MQNMSTIRTPDRNGVVGPFRSVLVAVIVVVTAFVATPQTRIEPTR
jgi:hypothetical protein